MANPSLALNGVTPDTPGGKPGKQLFISNPANVEVTHSVSVLIVDGARCNGNTWSVHRSES